jgi:predicted membrane-bound spermidine synthase
LIAIGVLGVIGFIIAGVLYLTSAGNDKRIEKAKSAMVSCVIGVLVGLAGFVALRFAANLLNRDEF